MHTIYSVYFTGDSEDFSTAPCKTPVHKVVELKATKTLKLSMCQKRGAPEKLLLNFFPYTYIYK